MTEKPLTPQQRYLLKLKQDPIRYADYLAKKRARNFHRYHTDPEYRARMLKHQKDNYGAGSEHYERKKQKNLALGLRANGKPRSDGSKARGNPWPTSPYREETGQTLQQWADKYNLSRERVRQLHKKWGTLNDELLNGRSRSKKGRLT